MTLRHQRTSRAFTLIEVMLAFAIFSLILGAIYGSWTAVNRGARIGLITAAEAQRERMTVKILEDALLNCQMYQNNQANYTMVARQDGEFAYISFVANLPASFPGSGRYGGVNLRRVEFWVEPGTDGQNQMFMAQHPPLLATNAQNQPYRLPLGRDISLFLMEFWEEREAKWVTELVNSNQIPRLVRFAVGFGHAENSRTDPRELINRIVSLPATVITSQMQAPGAPQ
jgi:prepilin-type N-terminal cleavage/methylation domain-containing protein